MSAVSNHGGTPYYFVPGPSRHPAMAAFGLFFVILGAGQWINGADWGAYSLAAGMIIWLVTLYQWFGDAIRESEGGQYSERIDVSFRWSMSWFIFSEVMFLCGLLWRALLGASAFGAHAGQYRPSIAVARFQGYLAQCSSRRNRLACWHGRCFHHHGSVAHPDHQYGLVVDLGRDLDHCAPRAVC